MHFRFLSSLFFCALLASGLLRAQTPEVKGGAELILVAKTMGKVTMTLDGTTSDLALNQAVPKKAKVTTGANSHVILLFSNGATTRLESDTELVIEEYLQDPFTTDVVPKTLQAEPTASKTELYLAKGELVGDVKPLHYDKGSSFKVRTPVGAAGIRGTTFRIIFRPTGNGQAFFTLSTAVGNVAFDAGNGNNAGGATPGPVVSGSGTVSGVSVPQGEQYSITVNVTTNAQGQMVVTTSAPVGTLGSISPENLQAVTTAASDIAVAVQTAVFSPAPPAPPGGGGGGGGTTGTVGQGQGVTTTTTIQTPTINAEIKSTLPPPATAERIVPTSPNN